MNKVLIVDDEAGIRRTLTRLVQTKGYEVFSVETGAEALEVAVREEPEVILIDLLLEDMPGLAVMKQVKNKMPAAECIIVTGAATKDSAVAAVNLGAFGFVTKPWDDDQLLVMIKAGMNQCETTKSLLESEEKLRSLQQQLAL
ncbi:hypothetical protein BVX97_05880 [bacterium E08(2017)]|nr:hypothetical protein BVX97_05880 [bacterium E08(2017)]